MTRAHPLLALTLTTSCLAGCSAAASGADSSGQFVAFATSFQGFRSWMSTPGVGPPGAPSPTSATDGGIHAGPMTTYLNHMPAKGSTSFPQGTILVKEQNDPALTDRQIFAMVKRGGGFNSAGAVGWEWFELRNLDESNVTIVWRGFGPQNGESYGGDPTVCNDCHAGARANDYVWTAGFSLTSP